ncbi:hypothetical protein SI65_04615 [Aspergillus cristatus]|uniref:Major facilitator superfamily (MFS) profile domain-containing protein n=1 Tax=Aspergillus cristatus TaxID=573508 RepID=A0A1E3BF82_ASPCR|nr:hypothetical protein SI65_04615 [Aspergillus cristatus]
MAVQPAEFTSASDSATPSSSARYTPVSDRTDDGPSYSHSRRPEKGSLRVQTDFGSADNTDLSEVFSDEDESYNGYNSGPELRENKPPRTGSSLEYSAAEESEVVKKFDRKLVPFLALLYLLSFLDRSNIGNAKIAGLTNDLDIPSWKYEWLLTAFYITYVLFEWMTLMYRLVPPHIYVSLCVCGWGLVASFQSLATSFGGMLILRILLGATEAAFGPGVPFYLSLFYKREELAFRIALFISAAPLATSFASTLAWVIVKLSHDGPIAPWRTLFLVEGFPSVVVAVFAWALIPDSPEKAHFLAPRERMVAELRLQRNRKAGTYQDPQKRKFNWQEVKKTLADPKAYITAFMFFSCNIAFSSMPVFLPTIIQDMGYSSLASQALSAPPFLVAFVVVLVTTYFSDRNRTRSPYIITHALLSSTSYLAIAATGHFHTHLSTKTHVVIRYLCVYPATSGFFSAISLILAWTMDNRVANEGKGTSVAILNIIGQCGPLLGTRLYPESDGPWYIRGMAVCSFFMLLVAVLAFALRIILHRANRAGSGDGMEIEMETHGEEREILMGDHGVDHVQEERFTYLL